MTKPTHALVPVEPTEDILDAYRSPARSTKPHRAGLPATRYVAMLAASPNAGKVNPKRVAVILDDLSKEYRHRPASLNDMMIECLRRLGLEIEGDVE